MASPRKPCKKCKKQIPAIALDCVFCGAKQEAPPLEELLPAALTRAKEVAARVEAAQASGDSMSDFADSFATEPTLVGLKVSDLAALGIGAPQPSSHSSDLGGAAPVASRSSVYGEPVEQPLAKPTAKPEPKSAPSSTKVTQINATIAPAPTVEKRRIEPALPDDAAMRLAQTVGIGAGIVMVIMFFLPWGGATSWQLLENLGGVAFMRQFWYLVGGLTLVLTGALPLPKNFRGGALMAITAPLAFLAPVHGVAGPLLAFTAVIAATFGAASKETMSMRRAGGIVAGLAAAVLFFLARGSELVHMVGWLAALAGFLAGYSLAPWTSARRSTAN